MNIMVDAEKYSIGRTLISRAEIRNRIRLMARDINKDYSQKKLVVLVLLKGSFIFAADLLRAIKVDSSIDFVKVESYGRSMKQKKLIWSFKMTDDIEGRDVLLIDDIYDSGKTLYNVIKYIRSFKPATIKVCVLLQKRRNKRSRTRVPLDYRGFTVPDVFVVGYGLDFAGKYRNLPHIAEIVQK
ncbi:MAG: hypoxanthine phosphoribosyltransferase [Candidatus Aureabacteria bacterium]|nr:hypoxanthine phosphoribosyltransferase [Candidatus Auribacterota bacterium]